MERKQAVEIDGVRYRLDEPADGERLCLVIADRGLTFAGMCDPAAAGRWLLIRGARCVIHWGTVGQHLAGLAASGPTTETTFGAARDVLLGVGQVVAVYECDPEAWRDWQ